MAGASLTTISAVMNLVYGDKMASAIRRDVLLPNLLEVEDDGNTSCTWKVKFTGRNTAGPQAEGYTPDPSSGFSTDIRKQATLAWAEYFSTAKVTGLAQAVGAANRGDAQDPLAEELSDAIDELAVSISEDTYGGSVDASPTEIEGLARAVDATGTYAGLAQGTYAEHASGEDTLATASLSLANLRTKLHRKFKDGCGYWPEFVTCSGTLFDAVCGLFNDQTRIMISEVTTAARGTVNLKAMGGFRAVEVDGVPYIEDRHATAATFYAHHSRNVKYVQLPPASSAVSPEEVRAAVKGLTGDDLPLETVAQMLAARKGRLQPYIEQLAKTGDTQQCMVKWYGQIKLKRRNAASKLLLT